MQYRRLLALFTTRGHHCMLFILSTWTPNFFLSSCFLDSLYQPVLVNGDIHICIFHTNFVRFMFAHFSRLSDSHWMQYNRLAYQLLLVLYCLQTCLRCCPGHEWRCWMCWSEYFCKEALHSAVSFGDQVLWITEIWELGIPRRKETY